MSIDTSGLAETEIAELAAKAAQMRAGKEVQVAEKIATPDNLIKWSEAGTGIGKALAATAKEVGIGADAFMSS